MMHPLGRIPSTPDTRDYPLAAYLYAPSVFARRTRFWEFHEHTLDQGATNHCTGFAAAHWRISAPVKEKNTAEQGHALYYKIKEIEGESGDDGGATMRGMAKTLKALGLIDTYAFAHSLDEVKRYILHSGPILAGTLWTEGMFLPTREGRILPTGAVLGGHAWLIRAYVGRGLFYGMSSWGEDWGQRGNFYIHENDLGWLLRTGREFVAAMQVERNS